MTISLLQLYEFKDTLVICKTKDLYNLQWIETKQYKNIYLYDRYDFIFPNSRDNIWNKIKYYYKYKYKVKCVNYNILRKYSHGMLSIPFAN